MTFFFAAGSMPSWASSRHQLRAEALRAESTNLMSQAVLVPFLVHFLIMCSSFSGVTTGSYSDSVCGEGLQIV